MLWERRIERGRKLMNGRMAFTAALSIAILAGCAGLRQGRDLEEAPDPLEPFNRGMFIINGLIDQGVIKPLAMAYVWAVPEKGRDAVRNVTRNIAAPMTFANDLAQGEMKRAGVTLGRIVINTTFGLGGFIDVADDLGLKHHSEDMGQTFAVYGVPSGPYVFLPNFGPNTLRGVGGQAASTFMNPLIWSNDDFANYLNFGSGLIQGVDIRARNLGRIDDIRATSVDYYTAIRSLWWQNRQAEIRNGRLDVDALPDFDFDDFDDEPSDG